VFPLGAPGNVRGVLTVGRRHGGLPFPQTQADVVASFAEPARPGNDPRRCRPGGREREAAGRSV